MSDDRVKLVRELSRSGVATVWEGWDNSLNRKVLVKSIHPQFARDADLRIRFEREARAIARLSHPNVVQIYDIQSGEDSLTLLLEFVEGETLGHLLKRRGVLPYDLALKITLEILSGLEQAHANGILHRDLKPENILLSHSGVVKITDFGLASLRDLPAVTQDGMVIGTPSYMSPEQALGGEIGPQTDLFTCGAMFFEMLTGQRLIQGESLGEAFQNVMKYRVPDLIDYQSVVPLKAREVLNKLIERDPTLRLESAAVARSALLTDSPEPPADSSAIAAFMKGEKRSEPIALSSAAFMKGVERSKSVSVSSRKSEHSSMWSLQPAERPESVAVSSRKSKRRKMWYVLSSVLLMATVFVLLWADRDKPDTKLQVEKPLRADSTGGSKVDTTSKSTVLPQTPQTKDTLQVERPVRAVDTTRTVLQNPQVQKPSGPAYATVNSTPWARVFYNDSLLGTTPLMTPIKLPSGKGTLLFLNDQLKLPVSRQIDIPTGDTTSINVNLQESVARVRIISVRPWADVFVDGEMKFRTPSTQILFLPLGKHTLELRHPDLPTYTKELTFAAGDPIYEVRVDLRK